MKVQFHLLVVLMLAFAVMTIAPIQNILIEDAAAASHEESAEDKKKPEGEAKPEGEKKKEGEEEPDC